MVAGRLRAAASAGEGEDRLAGAPAAGVARCVGGVGGRDAADAAGQRASLKETAAVLIKNAETKYGLMVAAFTGGQTKHLM